MCSYFSLPMFLLSHQWDQTPASPCLYDAKKESILVELPSTLSLHSLHMGGCMSLLKAMEDQVSL